MVKSDIYDSEEQTKWKYWNVSNYGVGGVLM